MPTVLEIVRAGVRPPRVHALNTRLEPRDTDGRTVDGKSRLVLVSPFTQFNAAFEHYLGKVDKKCDLDEVTEGTLKQAPYLDVKERERKKEVFPRFIIDLLRITTHENDVTYLRQFNEYVRWATETIPTMRNLKTRHLIPKPGTEFYTAIDQIPFDSPFDPNSLRVNGFAEYLKRDIEGIIKGAGEADFYLFGELIPRN